MDNCRNDLAEAQSELKALKSAINSGNDEPAKIVELLQSQLKDHQSQIIEMEAAIKRHKENRKDKDAEVKRLVAVNNELTTAAVAASSQQQQPSSQTFAELSANNESQSAADSIIRKEVAYLKSRLSAKEVEIVKTASILELKSSELGEISTQNYCLRQELQEERGRNTILETKVAKYEAEILLKEGGSAALLEEMNSELIQAREANTGLREVNYFKIRFTQKRIPKLMPFSNRNFNESICKSPSINSLLNLSNTKPSLASRCTKEEYQCFDKITTLKYPWSRQR